MIEQTSHDLQAELVERIHRVVPEDGYRLFPGGISMSRSSRPRETVHGVYEPTLCVVAQGKKVMIAGDERFSYDADHFLLCAVAVPVATHVVKASPVHPYMCLGIALDPSLVSSVMEDAKLAPLAGEPALHAIDVSPMDEALLDAAVRLVRTLEVPRDVTVLAPLIQREIVYRLLTGSQGARLRQIAPIGGADHRIVQAVAWLRRHVDQPVRIKTLARHVGMSASALYQQFRVVTGMSPLQYLKAVRLAEAQQLLLREDIDAATAAYRVGYNDVSQFTREYRRAFGNPPMRDVRARASALRTDSVT